MEIQRYSKRERERARMSSSAKHTGNRLTTRKKKIWYSHVRLQVSIYPPLLTFDTWFQVAIGLVDTKARSQTFNVQNFRTSVFLNVLSFSKTWVHIISLLSIFIPYWSIVYGQIPLKIPAKSHERLKNRSMNRVNQDFQLIYYPLVN
jgi:hypothetical protein